jgi:1,4-alpha-glucan branching enzyme
MQLNEPGTYTWTSRAVWLDSLASAEPSAPVLDSFQLTDAFIDIVRPFSKVSWMQDSAYAITWETNIPGAATIELVRNGTPVHVISDSVRAASGGFLWKIPVSVPEGTDYDIVIRSRDGNEFVVSDATADQRITIVKLPVSVTEERQQISCEVMPNPASTSLFISSEKEVSEVHIYASSGELVHRERVAGVGARLDVQHIPTGAYILHVVTMSGSVTRPLIINR